MAYIGKSIESGTFSVLDTSGNTYNGSNVTFSLGTQVGSPAQLLVSHDGVIQKPGTDYTLATGGTQITFTTAPASGASIFIVEISGAVGGPLDSDLNGTELILDADADTSITADTDDQIDIKVAGTDQITIKDGALSPVTDNDIDLGTSSLEFKDAYFDGTVTSDGGTFDTLGVGSAKDLGAGIHIKIADTGASANSAADELVIEGTSTVGMSFLTNNDQDSNITFGDSDANERGRIQYAHNGDFLAFHTTGSEQMRIDSSGTLFVGVTSSSGFNGAVIKDPDGISMYRAESTAGNGALLIYSDEGSTGANKGYWKNNGGIVNYQSNDGDLSDERLKKNIVDTPSCYDTIKALKVRNYKYKTDSDSVKTHIGLIAQETEAIDSTLVNTTDGLYGFEEEQAEEKYKQIYNKDLYFKMLKALQEAMAKIETLETKVKALEDA
jgi:hypothetical protein